MARQKIDAYWVTKIRELRAANPKAGAGAIARQLDETAEHTDPPSSRTVGRELRKFDTMLERDRAVYREFHWPEAMENGLLPWDASRVGLDVLRYHRLQGWPRPSVQRVLWHWRLSLATPETSIDYRVGLIAPSITPEGRVDLPPLDWELAFEPWLDEKHEYVWNRAFPEKPWPKQKHGGPQTLDEYLAIEAEGEK